jgi:hypothetical protein
MKNNRSAMFKIYLEIKVIKDKTIKLCNHEIVCSCIAVRKPGCLGPVRENAVTSPLPHLAAKLGGKQVT